MGTLILPSIHFNEQVYDSLKKPADATVGEGQRRAGTAASGRASSSSSAVSSSVGSRRSPIELPMTVSTGQTQRALTARRSARRRREQNVGHVARLSGAQCEQNRRRFESAVERADDGSARRSGDTPEAPRSPSPADDRNVNLSSAAFSSSNGASHLSSLPSIADTASSGAVNHPADRRPPEYFLATSCSIRSRTNGPTVVGSPLYNKRGRFPLDAARPLTTSGAYGYNHERYRTRTPAVQQHIDRVSSAFRVVHAPRARHSHTAHPRRAPLLHPSGADYADILLIPTADADAVGFTPEAYLRAHPDILSSRYREDIETPPLSGHQTPGAHGPEEMGEATKEGQDVIADVRLGDGISHGVEEIGVPDIRVSDSVQVVLHNQQEQCDAPVCTERRDAPVSTDQKKLLTATPKPGVKTRTEKKQEATPSKPTSTGKECRADSAGSGSASPSEPPSRPSSAKYWRAKTWVDDATVTSDKPSEPGDADPKPPEDKPEPHSKSKQEVKSLEKAKPEAVNKSPQRKPADAVKPDVEPEEEPEAFDAPANPENEVSGVAEESVEVVNLNDLKRKRQTLPDFICPSSEEKSRESAVMDWLETTSLHWAMKTAPLL